MSVTSRGNVLTVKDTSAMGNIPPLSEALLSLFPDIRDDRREYQSLQFLPDYCFSDSGINLVIDGPVGNNIEGIGFFGS